MISNSQINFNGLMYGKDSEGICTKAVGVCRRGDWFFSKKLGKAMQNNPDSVSVRTTQKVNSFSKKIIIEIDRAKVKFINNPWDYIIDKIYVQFTRDQRAFFKNKNVETFVLELNDDELPRIREAAISPFAKKSIQNFENVIKQHLSPEDVAWYNKYYGSAKDRGYNV